MHAAARAAAAIKSQAAMQSVETEYESGKYYFLLSWPFAGKCGLYVLWGMTMQQQSITTGEQRKGVYVYMCDKLFFTIRA